MRPSCTRMPTKRCMMVEAESDQLCVPAFSTSTLFLLQWHGAKLRTPRTPLLQGCGNLGSSWLFGLFLFAYSNLRMSTSVQHSELWAWMKFGNLWEGLWNRFVIDVILPDYSDECIFEDSPNSWSVLVLHDWDSVPIGSSLWSISYLVCVWQGQEKSPIVFKVAWTLLSTSLPHPTPPHPHCTAQSFMFVHVDMSVITPPHCTPSQPEWQIRKIIAVWGRV